jgi:hypothetical protein
LKQIDNDGATAFSHTVSVDVPAPDARSLELTGAFPSPVTGGYCTIEVQLLESGMVTIVLTDINGRKLRETERPMHAGRDAVSLDLAGLPSGVYSLQLETKTAGIRKPLVIFSR